MSPEAATNTDPDGEASDTERAQRLALMNGFAISYNGRHYCYRQYRYDRLEDAVAYARLCVGRPVDVASEAMPSPEHVEVPTAEQHAEMSAAGIRYANGSYTLGDYRYERLQDALVQSRR